ncbi:riboflavin biosynthesis protein RibBA [Bacteroidia bacterium]|nr:riboflavin biosynthesis protein RibBA [Bacteroidia bacterium]GHT83327.1 riboflavin biosynthesis protein RibBA [Bacteroidia bacterium]
MINTINEAIEDIKQGKFVIVVDDEDRENEGDFIAAAELITPDKVNFMLHEGRGVICVPMSESRCTALDLDMQVGVNTSVHETPFTVTVDKIEGCTTGVSASDRAATILALAHPATQPSDLARPGHINPLRAKERGVLRRAGHTEAAVDLMRMAGLQPVGVLIEVMNPDGTMARLPQLEERAKKFDLKIIAIKDLIAYRLQTESIVEQGDRVRFPTEHGDFDLIVFRQKSNGLEHVALVKGEWEPDDAVLVRMHSSCVTGDIFASQRCDCGAQLHTAMQMIENAGRGAVIYLNQEGRGIGLFNKIHAYKLQEQGMDTVEANLAMGFRDDERDYGIGANILHQLGIQKLRLLTNNPLKLKALEGYRIEIVEHVPIVIEPNAHNEFYLQTKKNKMGHLI